MAKQLCFPGLKPPKPTIRTHRIAERIARRLVAEINVDELYWEAYEVAERVTDVTEEIMRCGRPATVFGRLFRQQPPINDSGERGGHPYGWEGINEYCRAIADGIAAEELCKAIKKHERDY